MARARVVVVLASAVLVGGGLVAAQAAPGGDDVRAPRPVKWAKLSSGLAAVVRAEQEGGRGLVVARQRGLSVKNGRLLVVAESRLGRARTTAAIRDVRGLVVAAHADLVQAYVAPAGLGPLSRSDAVAYLRTPIRPVID